MLKIESEGGCGVIGLACTDKVAGRHLLPALCQMSNRGNGKGGGIAAVGLSSETFGTTQAILEGDYLLAIAYLDMQSQKEVEEKWIRATFEIDHTYTMPHLTSEHTEIVPPTVILYFVRVKNRPENQTEDDVVYQFTYRFNRHFYDAVGAKHAFVLSNGKNMLVLKMVGYGDDVIRYYQLEDFKAHVWIGHHRYPTKGKVWHPGGAHPFIGLNEALVHNGDFANYFSICEYLAQRDIHPLFLTDTEVSALLFDLLHRTYKYPLEYVIEALAPTTERDFFLLPKIKQDIYKQLQTCHMHGSPDGPWFFLVAQSLPKIHRLIGITDTSMLRPQVFALQTGSAPIGFSASEKQAIDATLQSLSKEDTRFWSYADHYWSARGGSHTDGGAFSFTVSKNSESAMTLACEDKFGRKIHPEILNPPYSPSSKASHPIHPPEKDLFNWLKSQIPNWDYSDLLQFLKKHGDLNLLTELIDQRYPTGSMRRSCLLDLFHKQLSQYLERTELPETCSINALGISAEGENSLAREIIAAYQRQEKKIILFNCQGQRFIGNGLGPNSNGVEIHVYGSSGDYLASGIDGATLHVHGSGQDQLAQIMKAGTLVVHGDVGQTFMYGAKGGKAFVLGNTAGRALINAVGNPRVIINGTSLDYLAESFMAGNPLKSGGFVVVNGIRVADDGQIFELENPYPGSNLFSLASGGAIYLRDPKLQVTKGQLNGGEFGEMTEQDWNLILPYLEENAHYFQIPVQRLLEHEGQPLAFHQAYRKIIPAKTHILQEEEAWVKGKA